MCSSGAGDANLHVGCDVLVAALNAIGSCKHGFELGCADQQCWKNVAMLCAIGLRSPADSKRAFK